MNNNTPIVSIILPSLNVVQYIEECITSVLNQTLYNIEIICVDGGSDDGTLEILKKYANEDSRIKLLTTNIKSYGYQMNLGIDNANGMYIGIVETDDFVDERMFEELYKLTKDGKIDMVKSNFYQGFNDDYSEDKAKCNLIIPVEFTIYDDSRILGGHPSIWAAIYKKSFLQENNIKFIEAPGGGWVDNPFLFETAICAKSIVYTNNTYYYYRVDNPNSSTNSINDLTMPLKRMLDIFDVLDKHCCHNKWILRRFYPRILHHIHQILCDDNLNRNNFIDVFHYMFKVTKKMGVTLFKLL